MRHQILRPGLMTIAVALCTTGAFGGQDGTAARGDSARAAEVLATTRKAIGRLDTLKTFSVEASVQRNVTSFRMTSDIEMLLDLPDKYARVETSTSGMGVSFTSGFNGEAPLINSGARTAGPGGAMVIRIGPAGAEAHGAEKPTPEQQADMRRAALRMARQEISRLMLGWFGMAHPSVNAEYTYAGEAESPDGKAHAIDVRTADGFSARVFIDQQTHLPLMVTYRAPQPRMVAVTQSTGGGARRQTDETRDEPLPLVDNTLFFDDWRRVDGVMFPHHISRASAGTPVEEWKITRVKVNPKIDPKRFEVQD